MNNGQTASSTEGLTEEVVVAVGEVTVRLHFDESRSISFQIDASPAR